MSRWKTRGPGDWIAAPTSPDGRPDTFSQRIRTRLNQLKQHPPTVFDAEIWKEIEGIFWRHSVPCMPRGAACDGLEPNQIETTKEGVGIHGGMWFLLGGRGSPNPRFELALCLSRPRFSSIQSVTVDKLRTAGISDSCLENDLLRITVT